jgi:hypothetical protein
MRTPKLAIENAVDGMTRVNGELKRASTFKEIEAIKGTDNIRKALRRTQAASVSVAEGAVEARQVSEAIKRTADLRFAELIGSIKAPEDVETIANIEGRKNRAEVHDLHTVGNLPKLTVKLAEAAIKRNHRESKNPVRAIQAMRHVPPKKVAAVLERLKDVPTIREAIALEIPDFIPTPVAKPAAAPVVVPHWLRDYQAWTLRVVASAIKLRGAVEAAVKDLSPRNRQAMKKAEEDLSDAVKALEEMRRVQ